ncbi:MAG: glycoside hydrolase family 28 protein [Microscillaceae bacterium]|nr:glycoside hydrolase family 28 protein [Microscillaceae bacterium]
MQKWKICLAKCKATRSGAHLFAPFALLLACASLACSQNFTARQAARAEKQAWQKTLPKILVQIKPPVFPIQTWTVEPQALLQDARQAINQSILLAHQQGGGQVIVPPGEYALAGSLFLRSGVNLHLSKGVVLKFSTRPEDYLPLVKVRWEGTVCYNYSPLIYAYQQENLAITGEGIVDGQASVFFHTWKSQQKPDQALLRQMGNDTVPEVARQFGPGHYLRPDGIQLFECKNILLEDFTLQGSPFWSIHPVFCENVTARRLKVRPGTTNDDGFDPESSRNVLIEDCDFITHDDGVAIKAGRDQDAWGRPGSENIVVRNCSFKTTVGSGVCIGSEMSGGVRQVFVENCRIRSQKHGLNFKSNPDRGGLMAQVFVRQIQVETAKYALTFTTDYHSWRGNHFPSLYHDFYLSNLRFGEVSEVGIHIVGLADAWIEGCFFAG